MGHSIDLNSDLGEQQDSSLDEQIMPFLSSCNIACGGHAGTPASIKESIRLARKFNVAIGAHPSYPDPANFGRVVMDISEEHLRESLRSQIALIHQECLQQGVSLHHIKPHGALYNEAARNAPLSEMMCKLINTVDPNVKLYGMAHSTTENVAKKHDVSFVREGFADRRYEPDRTLMSRKKVGAVITNETEVLQQVEELAINHRVQADTWLPIQVHTICLHSDTEGAVNLARKIRAHLEQKNVRISAVQ